MTAASRGAASMIGATTPISRTLAGTRPKAIVSMHTPGTATAQVRSQTGTAVSLIFSAMMFRTNMLDMLTVRA